MSEKKGFWGRLVGGARRKVITGVLVVGLAAVGVNLPEHVQLAVVTAIDSVIESM